jgi:hypothetical protein
VYLSPRFTVTISTKDNYMGLSTVVGVSFWIVVAYFTVRGFLASAYDFTAWVIGEQAETEEGQ